ncbi:MAG: YigZ family protein [Bacteroidota bacterium]|nr:YigZ family protein [Bacteroidota bacterium]
MNTQDTYKTITENTKEVLFKEKNSKFFGYGFAVQNEEQVKMYLEQLRKIHFSARHHCYAYQIGTEQIQYRANDDGEPNGTAGLPIYGQIQSFEVTNILIVVVRYFGGTKLGVSGLITAYRETAKMVLEEAEIVEKTIDLELELRFDYALVNKVMRIVKEKNLQVTQMEMSLDCYLKLHIRKNDFNTIYTIFENIHGVQITTDYDK